MAVPVPHTAMLTAVDEIWVWPSNSLTGPVTVTTSPSVDEVGAAVEDEDRIGGGGVAVTGVLEVEPPRAGCGPSRSATTTPRTVRVWPAAGEVVAGALDRADGGRGQRAAVDDLRGGEGPRAVGGHRVRRVVGVGVAHRRAA